MGSRPRFRAGDKECQAESIGSMARRETITPSSTSVYNMYHIGYRIFQIGRAETFHIALCGSSNRPIIVLQKKASTVKLSDLSGKWIISEAGGQSIPEGMEKQPFIEFNLSEKRIHGNAGCNLINGGFVADNENSSAISFPQLISTMMACPDMEVEGRVMKALNEVKSFGKLAGGGIGFYDADNTLVMVLVKK